MRRPEPTLKLGTRESLLAIAQSRIVANALMEKNPGLQIELRPIATRGDQNQNVPLSEVRDMDFFSSELDTALIRGEVDLCVHSLKDLGPDRPDSIVRAATPTRENPRDVIVFRRAVIERLRRGQPIRIGSSSKRRQDNVASFLADALPQFDNVATLQFSPIRGAVDKRLTRIARPEQHPDALDGVVLALAGLARLWADADGRRTIEPALADARWMILPLSQCPAAPAQGALAVECRTADENTRQILETIHDPATAALVQKELDAVSAVPENQRSGLGATALIQEKIGTLMYVRGSNSGAESVTWQQPRRPIEFRAWDGGELHQLATRRTIAIEPANDEPPAVFVAHWHAVNETTAFSENTRIWTSGVRSWQKLARHGLWVEGCADNLGFADILPTLACDVLRLPALQEWQALTHHDATRSWRETGIGHVCATYSLEQISDLDNSPELRRKISQATHFFWGSIDQYRQAEKWIPTHAQHACGTGKTAEALEKMGLRSLQLFPSRKEWQAWLR